MKLIGSKTSPFVRKVRVLLAEKALAFDFVEDDVWSAATAVPRHNPLVKVPALLVDEGDALYDSAVITEYLDTLPGTRFLPAAGLARARARRDEALGDGIAEAGILVRLEMRREPARQDPAWIARQADKVNSGIAALARALAGKPYLGGASPSLGDLACACALFWLEFRLPKEFPWRASDAALRAWAERLEARPSFAGTKPPDA
jgi:glutathione S-transferase